MGPAPNQAAPASGAPGPGQAEPDEAAKRQQEEDERRRQRRRKRGRIRELEEIRAELAEKELVLIAKQHELLEKEQTLLVLQQEARPASSRLCAVDMPRTHFAVLQCCGNTPGRAGSEPSALCGAAGH